MLELLTIFTLIGIGLAVVACIAVVGLLLKVTFKILLLPFWIFFALLKVLLVAGLVVLALVFAPLALALLILALVALPFLVLGGLVALGWGLATA